MKKLFLSVFLLFTIIASAARVVHFVGSCGLSANMSFADGTTDQQVATAFAAWNLTNCGSWPAGVRITKTLTP